MSLSRRQTKNRAILVVEVWAPPKSTEILRRVPRRAKPPRKKARDFAQDDGEGSATKGRGGLHFLEIVGVDLRVLGPLLGKILEGEDGGHRANGHASAAVDALVGIDVKLLRALELRLVFSRVNAIHGANVHACAVFCSMQGSAIT